MINNVQFVGVSVGLVKLFQYVFAQHDPHIDHCPNGNRDSRQSHDVGLDAKYLHKDEAHQNGQREQSAN